MPCCCIHPFSPSVELNRERSKVFVAYADDVGEWIVEIIECRGRLGVLSNKADESRNRIAKEGRERESAGN